MRYKSEVAPGLEYEIINGTVTLTRDGQKRTYDVKEMWSVMFDLINDNLAHEVALVLWANQFILKREGKMTNDEKVNLARKLGISYGQLQSKRNDGQLHYEWEEDDE